MPNVTAVAAATADFRPRECAAPLERRSLEPGGPRKGNFRARECAAPLKQDKDCCSGSGTGEFPRTRVRGPIEARIPSWWRSGRTDFRARECAAPLKRRVGDMELDVDGDISAHESARPH